MTDAPKTVRKTLKDGTIKLYTYPRGENARPGGPATGAHLYVIHCASGVVKIGRSNDPVSRLEALRNASAFKMILVKVYPNRGHEERAIHRILDQHRLAGEWFRDTNEFRWDLSEALGTKVTFKRSAGTVDEERHNFQGSERHSRDAFEKAVAAYCEEIIRQDEAKSLRRKARHV